MEARSRRAIKTPKRFDDEAFETPPKSQHTPKATPTPTEPTTATAAAAVTASKPSPEPTIIVPKSIFKVKLSKVKPRETKPPVVDIKVEQDVPATTPSPTIPTIQTASATPAAATPISKNASSHQPKSLKRPRTPPKQQQQQAQRATAAADPETSAKSVPEPAIASSKSIIKVKLNKVRLREPKSHTTTVKSVPDPTSTLSATTTITTPKNININYRPKMSRPRTPPVFLDLIPNVILPFWDARTAAEDHEDDNVKELVHCHCGITEECGLMVQCETCLTWQHAHCLGMEKPEDAPDGYTCKACSDPKFARESMKWAYDQDWLTKGNMKQFPCDPTGLREKNVILLRRINHLIANVLNIHQMIHSLRVKSRILLNATDDDPELKLFRTQWPVNYQHRDGTPFIPSINHPTSTPASTISVIAETPDPSDLAVDNVVDAALPDIGQLDDVSAILENTFAQSGPIQPNMVDSNTDATPNDCRSNLKLHIHQTEEYIKIELGSVENDLTALEKECSLIGGGNERTEFSLESLKNDLQAMKKYISIEQREYED